MSACAAPLTHGPFCYMASVPYGKQRFLTVRSSVSLIYRLDFMDGRKVGFIFWLLTDASLSFLHSMHMVFGWEERHGKSWLGGRLGFFVEI
jgi:hypothetical protein